MVSVYASGTQVEKKKVDLKFVRIFSKIKMSLLDGHIVMNAFCVKYSDFL
jgi:hypothetical protein